MLFPPLQHPQASFQPRQRDFEHYNDYVQEALRQVVSATGHQQRLAREGMVMKNGVAPSEDAVKQERLVVEVASGIKMLEMGLPARLSDESLGLADYWCRELKENPYPLCLAGMTLVIVKPDVGVSTREAYAGVRPHVPEVPLAERLRRPVAEWQGLVTNDFEPHIFAAHPAIREARDSLLAAGAVYASMSGSGSAVFGLFDDAQKAGNLRLQTPFVYTL